jgi:hypothetical protein
MKFRLVFLWLLFVIIAGCSLQKAVTPPYILPSKAGEVASCHSIYAQGHWSFVHSVEFTMKNGSGSRVIGVSDIEQSSIKAALLTPEGFTLFEAKRDTKGTVEITRAVPPFDKPDFAGGLLETLDAIFREPVDATLEYGWLESGEQVCRYHGNVSGVIDIFVEEGDCWQRNEYSDGTLDRTITGKTCKTVEEQLVAEEVILQTLGSNGYTLNMMLIRAEKLK